MKYIALLRGINVGGNKKVDMKTLKSLFETLGFTEISTYINSGNVFFTSEKTQNVLNKLITQSLLVTFGFEIPLLIIKHSQIVKIAKSIPTEYTNDQSRKTDIAYLFPSIDHADIINELPINFDVVNVIYLKGALIMSVKREDYNKSKFDKLVNHKIYKSMTIRNANTARYLASK